MKLRFFGGVDVVTGSQHMVEAGARRLLRDCGLYQGKRKIAEKVNRALPFDAVTVDAVQLSHAHIDHCGNLPSLLRDGFDGPIHATTATCKLAEIMLMDAARIQEQDAAYLNQKTSRKGYPPVEPLYTVEDAFAVHQCLVGHSYHEEVEILPGIRMNSLEAGYILGSELNVFHVEENGKNFNIGFAVDLGRHGLPIIRDPEIMEEQLDALVMESTYGDREHGDICYADDDLAEIINQTIAQGGKALIPSFALERTQEVIFHLVRLVREERMPEVPIYIDSPMASAVTRIFARSPKYMDDEFIDLRETGRVFEADFVHFISSVPESKELTASKKPCIVISASGMCEHGRILHHLKSCIGDSRSTILIVGYQAENTLGRRLVEGAEEVRIFGDFFERKADVRVLNAFSAHADRLDLFEYTRAVKPKSIYLVHGEQKPREALAETLRSEGFDKVYLPRRKDSVELT